MVFILVGYLETKRKPMILTTDMRWRKGLEFIRVKPQSLERIEK